MSTTKHIHLGREIFCFSEKHFIFPEDNNSKKVDGATQHARRYIFSCIILSSIFASKTHFYLYFESEKETKVMKINTKKEAL